MLLSIRITFIIIFILLCHVYHLQDTSTSQKYADTIAKKKQMLSMTFRNGEPVEYHKKRFGLFYRPHV